MGINLRGRDIGVPQHALQAPQIRSAFQQMGCKGVTQDVGRQIVEDPRLFAVPRQQLARKPAATWRRRDW